MNPKISVDYPTLKADVRQGLSPEAREYWWPILLNISESKSPLTDYPNVVGSAERLLTMCTLTTPLATLKKDASMERKYYLLMEALTSAKSMGDCPLLVSGFAQIVAETIPQFDICHLICRDAVESTERRLSTTTEDYLRKLHIFRETLKTFMPKTHAALEEMEALQDKYLNLMFIGFFKTLLPKKTVLRVVDAYLLEGDKVLVRYGLALLTKYKRVLKAGKYRSAQSFWQTIQEDARNDEIFEIFKRNRQHYESSPNDTELPSKEPIDAIGRADYMTDYIHKNAYDTGRDAFQKMVKPMKVSTKRFTEISESFQGAPGVVVRVPFYPPLGYGMGPSGRASFIAPEGGVTVAQDLAMQSEILTEHKSAQLLALCCPSLKGTDIIPVPVPPTFDHGLYLRFSTAEHGFSLSSLYAKTQGVSPLILVIKSINGESQYTIGAYLTEPFKSPSNRVFGNGESFVFSLMQNNQSKNNKSNIARKFPWVKSKNKKSTSELFSVDPSVQSSSMVRCEGTSMQFAVFSTTGLVIGASEEFGTNAIRLNADLSTCYCGPSDTYGHSTYSILEAPQLSSRPASERTDVDVTDRAHEAGPGPGLGVKQVSWKGDGPVGLAGKQINWKGTSGDEEGVESFLIESVEVFSDRPL